VGAPKRLNTSALVGQWRRYDVALCERALAAVEHLRYTWPMDRPVPPSQSMWDANDVVLAAHYQRLRRSPAYEGFVWNGTIPLDEAARKGLVLRRIQWWWEAVETQHERLTRIGGDHPFRTDLNFYIIAINNLVDTVKVIRTQYSNLPDMLSAVDHALNRFIAACPDLEILRDIIEHSDAYDHMRGDLQLGKGKGKRVPPSKLLPKQRAGQFENYSLGDGDAQLSIFNKYMRVSTTTPAARQLAQEVLALKDQLPG
jgi:hypothetical protein